MSESKTRIVTHNGGFHADDVFAVATLQLVHGEHECEVIRSRDPEVIATGDWVLDVGFEYNPGTKRFDHHQESFTEARENGVTYSSFGLVWRECGAQLCGGEAVAAAIERSLVMPIDATDNGLVISEPTIEGVWPYSISRMIASYNLDHDRTEDDQYAAFMDAVMVARSVISNEIRKTTGEEALRAGIIAAYENADDKRLIVLDDAQGWSRVFISYVLAEYSEPLYFIRQHATGSWQVIAVQDEAFTQRLMLPEPWRGLSGIELQKVTEVSDAVFCHKTGFMCIAETRESALKMAEKAFAYSQEKH